MGLKVILMWRFLSNDLITFQVFVERTKIFSPQNEIKVKNYHVFFLSGVFFEFMKVLSI